jgi:putative membrane protein
MTLRWLLASIHLLALGIGLGSVWARGQALRGTLDRDGLNRVFAADRWWAIAAGLWIGTGVWRLLGGFEKGTTYYLQSHLFMTKMALLLAILALEVWPMVALIRWRMTLKRGEAPDLAPAPRLATISTVQAVLVIGMLLCATAIARGLGMRAG